MCSVVSALAIVTSHLDTLLDDWDCEAWICTSVQIVKSAPLITQRLHQRRVQEKEDQALLLAELDVNRAQEVADCQWALDHLGYESD